MSKKKILQESSILTTHPEIAKEWHPSLNYGITAADVSRGSNKKIYWLCENGHVWISTPHNRTKNNRKCPYCSGYYLAKGENDLETLYPEIAKEWDYIKNEELKPSDVKSLSTRRVWWICEKGHEWQTDIRHRTIENNGCPYCSGRYHIIGENDLETLYPEIAKQWNYNRNGGSKPLDYKGGSSKKVWWICEKGHEWCVSITHRTSRGSGCPYCSGRYAITGENDLETLYPEIAKQWDYEKNGERVPSNYKPYSNVKVWWKCNKGHRWKISIYSRIGKGTGCPYCAKLIVIPGKTDLQTLFPNIANEYDYEKNKGTSAMDLCAKSNKKVWWKCKEGHSWEASVISRTNLKSGCPYCAGQRPVIGVNDLGTLYPELAAEWNIEKNKKLKPQDCTISSGKRVWWICSKGHEWQTVINTRTGKNKCGCPYCSGRYAINGVNDLQTINSELALEWHPYKNRILKPSDVLPNSNKKVWWICEKGHEWQSAVNHRSRGRGCPYCVGKKPIVGVNDLATLFPELIEEWDYEKNNNKKPEMFMRGSCKKVWWKCKEGHSWRTAINTRAYGGSQCPYCRKLKNN